MLRAITYSDADQMRRDGHPGSVRFDMAGDAGALWFICPCGCDATCRIPIGRGHKPPLSPSWTWCGSKTEPTLRPSIHQTECGWHGWLRHGYWESC